MSKKIRYMLEAAFVWLIIQFLRCFSFKCASNIGAWLACKVGPHLKAHTTALKNLARIMPNSSEDERRQITKEVWDNLGRTAAELVHLGRMNTETFERYVTIKGLENVEGFMAKGQAFAAFSGHMANWEIGPQLCHHIGLPMVLAYRPANNPYVNNMINKLRANMKETLVPKGVAAARKILKAYRAGHPVGILADQKYNEGILSPFLGIEARTTPIMADLAVRYGVPIVPYRVVRKNKHYFECELFSPLEVEGKNTQQLVDEMNQILGDWVREKPGQWFWVHNRWPKALDKS